MQKKKINILCYIKFKHGYIEKQKLKNWKYLPCMQQEKKINKMLSTQKNRRKKYAGNSKRRNAYG